MFCFSSPSRVSASSLQTTANPHGTLWDIWWTLHQSSTSPCPCMPWKRNSNTLVLALWCLQPSWGKRDLSFFCSIFPVVPASHPLVEWDPILTRHQTEKVLPAICRRGDPLVLSLTQLLYFRFDFSTSKQTIIIPEIDIWQTLKRYLLVVSFPPFVLNLNVCQAHCLYLLPGPSGLGVGEELPASQVFTGIKVTLPANDPNLVTNDVPP